MKQADINFLARFVSRGWLAADRLKHEEAICRRGQQAGYLHRERGEWHFTEAGKIAMQATVHPFEALDVPPKHVTHGLCRSCGMTARHSNHAASV